MGHFLNVVPGPFSSVSYIIDKNYDSMQKMFSLPRTKDEMKALFRVQIKKQVRQKHIMDFLERIGLFKIIYHIKHKFD